MRHRRRDTTIWSSQRALDGRMVSRMVVDATNIILTPLLGVVRDMLFINGKFPGPVIEMNRGDRLVVNVTNKLTSNDTSMHWHGIYQNGTNWYDGTHGIVNLNRLHTASAILLLTLSQALRSAEFQQDSRSFTTSPLRTNMARIGTTRTIPLNIWTVFWVHSSSMRPRRPSHGRCTMRTEWFSCRTGTTISAPSI
jgi:Multicopper oxidase